MLMQDDKILANYFKSEKYSQDSLNAFDRGVIIFILAKDERMTLEDIDSDDMLLDNFIGFSPEDYCEVGQRFINPFDKCSYLEVTEYDPKLDRALLVKKAVSSV